MFNLHWLRRLSREELQHFLRWCPSPSITKFWRPHRLAPSNSQAIGTNRLIKQYSQVPILKSVHMNSRLFWGSEIIHNTEKAHFTSSPSLWFNTVVTGLIKINSIRLVWVLRNRTRPVKCSCGNKTAFTSQVDIHITGLKLFESSNWLALRTTYARNRYGKIISFWYFVRIQFPSEDFKSFHSNVKKFSKYPRASLKLSPCMGVF